MSIVRTSVFKIEVINFDDILRDAQADRHETNPALPTAPADVGLPERGCANACRAGKPSRRSERSLALG